MVEISAKTKLNLDKLVESIILQAEILDLKTDFESSATGIVLESKIDVGRGPVATIIVTTGTLKKGNFFVSGLRWGKIRAIINDKGGIDEVVIINSGRGYTKNAKVTAITPKVLKNFSATDTTQHLEDLIKKDPDWNNAIGFTESSFTGDDPIKDVQVAAGSSQGSIDFPIDHDNIAVKLSNAKLKIAAFDEIGGITRIRVVKPGSGYDPEEPPDVFVSDPEYIEYESPDIGDIAALGQGISDQFQEFDSSLPTGGRQGKRQDPLDWINTNTGEDFAGAPTEFASLNTTGLASPTSPNQVANTGFTLMNTPIASAAPDSYIRMAELDEDSVTKLCFDLPPNCLEVNGRGNVLDAIPKDCLLYTSPSPRD